MSSVFGSVNTSDVSRRQAGFSLVELMVVITIIGILAGIAVPRFQTFRARSQQSEAKSGLNALYLSTQAYQSNYNAFPCTGSAYDPTATPACTGPAATTKSNQVAAVGFLMGGKTPKYQYRFISDLGGWSAFAISVRPVVDNRYDTQRINTNKVVCAPYDGVAALPAQLFTPAGRTAANQTLPDGSACFEVAANEAAPAPALIDIADCALSANVPANCLNLPGN